MCTDEAPYVEIDVLLTDAVDAVKDLEAKHRFAVGDRVTHLDMLAQNGTPLPMGGTVVGIKVEFLVEWDGEEVSPLSGWTPTHYYPPDSLMHRPLDNP